MQSKQEQLNKKSPNFIKHDIFLLKVTNNKLQVTNNKLQVTNNKLQVTTYNLQVTNNR